MSEMQADCLSVCLSDVSVPVDGADGGGEISLQFGDEALSQPLDAGFIRCLGEIRDEE